MTARAGSLRAPAVLLALVLYVLAQSYQGRVDLRDSQVIACHRGARDRAANARGWRIAERARYRANEFDVAAAYAAIARELEQRSAIDCAAAFPAPTLIPHP